MVTGMGSSIRKDSDASLSTLCSARAKSVVVRLLIFKTSSTGNVIHALPMAADIVRACPGTTRDWLAEEGFPAIPAMRRRVSAVHWVDLRRWRHAPLGSSTRADVAALKASLRAVRDDVLIDVQDLLKSAWVARWAYAPVASLGGAGVSMPASQVIEAIERVMAEGT